MTSLKIYTKGFEAKNFMMLTVAGIINAFGVTFFLSPVKLYDSGISGTSMLLSQMSGLSLSTLLIILNVPLFIYGLKRQGIKFTVYSIYAVGVYSFMAWLITDVLPVDVSVVSPLAGSDLLLCALFGGMISGTGSGLTMRWGGAMDGIDVLAVIFAKKMGISVGTFVMLYNVVLYVVCGVALESWILPLYSIVTYMAALKTIDFIVDGFDRAKCAMIVTECPNEVSAALSQEFESGSTRVNAIGGYSNRQKTIVWFVVNRFQVTKMKDIIHRIDPKAYITLHEVADVFKASI
ncbi:MAG: YitT family protein [Oscillospiraceae bacterium]|nr:YitT family protein [Oscillospiraceae bacterium]